MKVYKREILVTTESLKFIKRPISDKLLYGEDFVFKQKKIVKDTSQFLKKRNISQ